jgi:prepilin-type N-terminal cleavage/methylation domain-containing protein
MGRRRSQGFSLIEVSLVTILIGVMTGVLLPMYIQQSDVIRRYHAEAALAKMQVGVALVYARNVLEGTQPLYPSDIDPKWYPDGKIPINPYNDLSTVAFWDGVQPIDGSTGWQYNPKTGDIRLNSATP